MTLKLYPYRKGKTEIDGRKSEVLVEVFFYFISFDQQSEYNVFHKLMGW